MSQKTDQKEPGTQERSKSQGSTCPECGDPIDDLRASCKKCGYEYKDSDYSDTEKGNEFIAGTNMDDEGNEITDEGPGAEEGTE